MNQVLRPFVFFLALSLIARSAVAQTAPPESERHPTVEITPFASYFFEGNVDEDFFFNDKTKFAAGGAFGLIVALPVGSRFDVELTYSKLNSRLDSDEIRGPDLALDAEYLHVGGVFNFSIGHLEPFIFGSIGATQLTPDVSDFDDEVLFSAAFGGGLKANFNEHVGLRLHMRLLSTLIEEQALCNRFDCYYYDNETLFQVEAAAGLTFSF